MEGHFTTKYNLTLQVLEILSSLWFVNKTVFLGVSRT